MEHISNTITDIMVEKMYQMYQVPKHTIYSGCEHGPLFYIECPQETCVDCDFAKYQYRNPLFTETIQLRVLQYLCKLGVQSHFYYCRELINQPPKYHLIIRTIGDVIHKEYYHQQLSYCIANALCDLHTELSQNNIKEVTRILKG